MACIIKHISHNYDEYVAASLKEADAKVADGTMDYYTADKVRSRLESVLDKK